MSIAVQFAKRLAGAAFVAGACAGAVGAAHADVITYQNMPTSLSIPPNVSHHAVGGPVIADEFVPVAGGQVTTLTWWGSAATSNSWELVLQNNNPVLNQPALTPVGNISTGGVKAVVSAAAVPYAPLPGIFQYTANFSSPFAVYSGVDYWITVANFDDGWNWAQALAGPTIGSENFNAHSSTGGLCLDGGPHCGPWTDIHTDFAVQISVPEPTTLALLGVALAGLGFSRRKRG